ncbi:MAG TPA: hypothetical protein PK450_06725 [Paracoccaceae bacterium]|nr:hypothetical protein [Paracoccaceae bacterium]
MKQMITHKSQQALCVTVFSLILRAVGMSSLALFMLAGFSLSTRFML